MSVAIEFQHLSDKFCCCVSFAQGDVLSGSSRGYDDSFCVRSPVHQSARDPHHKGRRGLTGLLLTSEVAVRFDHDIHGRSWMNVCLFVLTFVFMCDCICCVVGDVIGIRYISGLLPCWWWLMCRHGVMRVFEVSVLCSFDVNECSV